MGTDNKTPEYLARFPFGQVPSMDTVDGPLFESNAIARYIARKGKDVGLLGANAYESSQIDQWIEALRSAESSYMPWVGQIFGRPYDEKTWNAGKEGTVKFLTTVDKYLAGRQFFVGDHVTLADILYASIIFLLFKLAVDPQLRAPLTHLQAWFDRCCALPHFKEVLGEPVYATAVAEPKNKA